MPAKKKSKSASPAKAQASLPLQTASDGQPEHPPVPQVAESTPSVDLPQEADSQPEPPVAESTPSVDLPQEADSQPEPPVAESTPSVDLPQEADSQPEPPVAAPPKALNRRSKQSSAPPVAESTLAADPPAATSEPSPEASLEAELAPISIPKNHPIPPPTERLQYRAIGLIQGRYLPSATEFNQGILLANDGTFIDAAVLGRLVTLLKKHLDLGTEYLWVVYPRTPGIQKPQASETPAEEGAESSVETVEPNPTETSSETETSPRPKLHVQMAGVWAPELLRADQEIPSASEPIEPDIFSIRGEAVFHNKQEEWVIIKIIQKPKQQGDKPFIIRLKLLGQLPDERPLKKFWDIKVRREGDALRIESGEMMANFAKPKGKKPGQGKFRKGGKKPYRKYPQDSAPQGGGQDRPKPKPQLRQPKEGS